MYYVNAIVGNRWATFHSR